MKDFMFQQETNGGWVIGKSVSGYVILFGPTLSDVVDQASKAGEFLAEFRRHHSDANHPVVREMSSPWLDLEVA